MTSEEIVAAMKAKAPVKAKGIEYLRITEYVLWTGNDGKLNKSVGVLDKNTNCLVRVLADQVQPV